MKFKLILIIFISLTGCQSIQIFKEKPPVEEKKIENVFYENFSAKGVVKFYAKNKNVSSRFKFIKNKDDERIEFLDVFNNVIVTFQVDEKNIEILDGSKKLNSESLEKIVNRPYFKKIILNFSNILTGRTESAEVIKKYSNGLFEFIKNEKYSIYYKMYNKDHLPVNMKINFLNILFDLKIVNWTLIK